MDPASVEAAFQLTGPDGAASTARSWDAEQTTFTFKPAGLLERATDYASAWPPAPAGRRHALNSPTDITIRTCAAGSPHSEPALANRRTRSVMWRFSSAHRLKRAPMRSSISNSNQPSQS